MKANGNDEFCFGVATMLAELVMQGSAPFFTL